MPNNKNKPFSIYLILMIINDLSFSWERYMYSHNSKFLQKYISFCSNKDQTKTRIIYKFIRASMRRLIVQDYSTNRDELKLSLFSLSLSLSLPLVFISCQFDKMTLRIVIVHRRKREEKERAIEKERTAHIANKRWR
jgi:hypothetical protein